jgi:alpha-L-rhamnosidase
MLPGARAILSFFAAHRNAGGRLGRMPWWNFVDWVDGWNGGVPPAGTDGGSAQLDLQLALAYDWAADLEHAFGSKALGQEYADSAAQLRNAIRTAYWDPARRMFSDTEAKDKFSQHTNALAVLAGVIDGAAGADLMDRVIADKSLAQCSIYFRYYLHLAVAKTGGGDRYLELLDPWRRMLARGLTTWSETEDPTRSDCHAWGASPNIEVFRTVLGIDSAAPGFRRVLIKPAPGKLAKVSGAIPHPKGEISVALDRQGDRLSAEVSLPPGVEGEFVWKGATKTLAPGHNALQF